MNQLNALKIKEGLDQFNSQRLPGDMDLVKAVLETMRQEGFSEEALLVYEHHPLILEAMNKQPHIQRWQLNRFWFLQLVSLEVPTMQIRSYLVPDGTEENWLGLMIQHILPFAKAHQLPKLI